MDDLTIQLTEILRRNLLYAKPDMEIPVDVELVQLGLDSMSAINLLVDIEDNLAIVIPDTLLTAETFRTLSSLKAVVEGLVAANA